MTSEIDTPGSTRSDVSGAIAGWLAGFAISVIVGMQAGTIFKGLGDIGDTRVADWVDLAVPFAVLACAAMIVHRCTTAALPWVVYFVGAVSFTLGHGLHLSANSISNVADKHVAHADIVHLWDEVVSHRFWYIGLHLVLGAMLLAARDRAIRLGPLGWALTVLVSVTLVNIYIEGGMGWEGLVLLASGIAAGWTWRDRSAGRIALVVGGLGFLLLAGWGVYWYAADGTVFPEYSDVGWI